jgi:hypothetical protein
MTALPQIIYILGSGRSGSTVLERVLNSADRVCAVGELHALWRLPWDTLTCSCGRKLRECDFWLQVFGGMKLTEKTALRLRTLEHEVIRNKFLLKKRFQPDRFSTHPKVAEFNKVQSSLFQSIRKASGCSTIVDISKSGPRAWILSAEFKVQILHCRRDATDVLTSWRRAKYDPSRIGNMQRPSVARAALDWAKAEQTALMLGKRTEVIRIDHEEFAKAPRNTLTSAFDGAFPDISDNLPWICGDTIEPSTAYHSILGNPDRFQTGPLQIRPPQTAGAETLPRNERLQIKAIGSMLDLFWP